MQQASKRLELIKPAITIEDEEIIDHYGLSDKQLILCDWICSKLQIPPGDFRDAYLTNLKERSYEFGVLTAIGIVFIVWFVLYSM